MQKIITINPTTLVFLTEKILNDNFNSFFAERFNTDMSFKFRAVLDAISVSFNNKQILNIILHNDDKNLYYEILTSVKKEEFNVEVLTTALEDYLESLNNAD